MSDIPFTLCPQDAEKIGVLRPPPLYTALYGRRNTGGGFDAA